MSILLLRLRQAASSSSGRSIRFQLRSLIEIDTEGDFASTLVTGVSSVQVAYRAEQLTFCILVEEEDIRQYPMSRHRSIFHLPGHRNVT